MTVSQTYTFRMGKVTKIIDGNSIVFEKHGSLVILGKEPSGTVREYTVHLAGIDPMANEEILIKYLRENILGKTVQIVGNLKEDSDDSFFGILSDPEKNYYDVNRHFLEKGMAGFIEPDYFYSVSYVTMCVYQQVVEKAKKEKLGIWAR